MCHQKGDFFVRKKVLSLLLAFCMIVAPFTVVQVAAAEPTKVQDSGPLADALAAGGSIQLDANISTKNQSGEFGRLVVTANDVVLDLNGHELTTEQIEIKPGASLTIQDSSDDETGIVLGTGNRHLILVWPAQNSISAASFTLESGTVQTPDNTESNIHTIYSSGTVKINGGRVIAEGPVSAAIYVNGYNKKFIDPLETKPDTFIPVANQVSCTLSGDASIQSKVYGVCLFGEGPDSNGAYDYDKVKLNILDNASINVSGTDPNDVDGGGQGIATNSSGDKYAGFTIEMSGGSIDAGTHGCGMYLPAIGKTTVTGGRVYGGNQGIRIAAGELTVSGDAVIQNNEARKKSDNDLVNGGSGGTAGAIVAGKASSAYKGGLQINIEGGTIENKATGNADAIVVSDKNMAHSNFTNQSLAVTVTGGEITGNVYCISNLDTSSTTATQDGGKSSITLKGENVQVTGDVENASHSPLLIAEGATVTGDAKKTGKNEGCAVVIDNATVKGKTEGVTNLGDVEDGKILSTNGKTYTDLATALRDLPADGTLYLGKGTFQLSSAVTIDKSVTLRGQGVENTIIQGVSTEPTFYFTVTKGNVVFDGMTFKNFGGNHSVGSGTAVIKVPSGSDVNTNLTVKNADFENFNRAAIDIEAGKYAISGCSIDCNNEYSKTHEQDVLTKGIKIGYGITKASGTIDNVQISSSASTYKEWRASAIEVYQNGSAVITNTEIDDCLTGIWVDSYYNARNDSSYTGTSAYVELGKNVKISPKEGGDALIVAHRAEKDLHSSVYITDGEYDGPVYIKYMQNGEAEYAENTDDNFILISGGRFHNLTPEGMGEDISYIADGYHMDSNGNIKKDTSSPSSSSSSDDPGSALPLAPGASHQPGEPTDPTDPTTPSGFVSDTTSDLTVSGTYQFRITSLDGTIPFLTADNANFRVEFASQEGNDFFFKIHAQGAAGSTTVVSVNGVRLLTATVGGSATGVISDTTAPFTVKKGETYQFRLTASARPSFAAGSASFTVEYAGQIGSDYFYKVYAAGNVGDGCGFYINGEASPVAVATIA